MSGVRLAVNQGVSGFTVRDGFRGSLLGYVKRAARRYWIATCSRCGEPVGDGPTRPAAANRLPDHWKTSHPGIPS